MECSYPEVVVAGLDGSVASMSAARWAAEDALRRGVTLRLVHVMLPRPDGTYPALQLAPSKVDDATRRWTRTMLQRARSTLLADYPGLQVETVSHVGSPVTILMKESRQATVTVVGASGGGRISDALFGSIGAKLATHARGRMVFVPTAGAASTEPSPWAAAAGPVVVGIDGAARTEPAIAFAFQEAAVRNSLLIAVHVGTVTHSSAGATEQVGSRIPVARSHTAVDDSLVAHVDDERHRQLVELTARWSARYPTVPVRSVVLHGRPIPMLLRYLAEAPNGRPQLIVVGNRLHGWARTVLTGRTGRSLARQAGCPVAVVQEQRALAYAST